MKTLNKIIVALFVATSSIFSQNKEESFDLIKRVNEEIDKLHEELGVKDLLYFSFKYSKPKDTSNVYYQNLKKKLGYQFTDRFYNDLVKFYKRDRYFKFSDLTEYSYTCSFQLFDDEKFYYSYYEKHKNDRDYLSDLSEHANLNRLFKFKKITSLDQLKVGDKIVSLWKFSDDSLPYYLDKYPVYIYGNSQIIKSFRRFDEKKFCNRGYLTKLEYIFRSNHVYYIYKIVELNERYSIYFVTASYWNESIKYRLYFKYFIYDKELNYVSDVKYKKMNPKDTLGFTELSFHLKCYGIELYKASYTGDYIPNEISYNKDIENKKNEEKSVVKKQKTNKNNLKVNINKFKN
jgi:hypothetical protein